MGSPTSTPSSSQASTPELIDAAVGQENSPGREHVIPPEDLASATEAATPPHAASRPQAGEEYGGDLGSDQTRTISSVLLDPIEISFSRPTDPIRLPARFYRTFYETSTTLSCYVTKDTHVKHRAEPKLRCREGNAFQAIAQFFLAQDLNKERIERHLVWNKKRNPSCYISVFDQLCHAERRAAFHYDNSQRIGHRVSIAKIKTAGLRAATVKAKYRTTVTISAKSLLRRDVTIEKFTLPTRDVNIPVWIRETAVPKDGSSITPEQLTKSGADMWVSITEIRRSDLKKGSLQYDRIDSICAKGHDYEWLACGVIEKSLVTKVMPWDGKVLHENRKPTIIRSLSSTEPWVFNWDQQTWLLDPTLTALARYRDEEVKQMRKRILDTDEARDEEMHIGVKKPRLIELRIVRPYVKSGLPHKETKPIDKAEFSTN